MTSGSRYRARAGFRESIPCGQRLIHALRITEYAGWLSNIRRAEPNYEYIQKCFPSLQADLHDLSAMFLLPFASPKIDFSRLSLLRNRKQAQSISGEIEKKTQFFFMVCTKSMSHCLLIAMASIAKV
jgi:hypothetical protein